MPCAPFLDHASLDLGDLDMRPLRAAFDELQPHAASQPYRPRGCIGGSRSARRRRRGNASPLAPELELILSCWHQQHRSRCCSRARIVVANCHELRHRPGSSSTPSRCYWPWLRARRTAHRRYGGRWQQSSQFRSLTSPSSNWKARPACSSANWAGRWRGWRRRSVCACCRSVASDGSRLADRLPLWRTLPRVDALPALPADLRTPAGCSAPPNWR